MATGSPGSLVDIDHVVSKSDACDFLKMYVEIKYQWGLAIAPADATVVTNRLTSAACGP